jgi:hypothetical protein
MWRFSGVSKLIDKGRCEIGHYLFHHRRLALLACLLSMIAVAGAIVLALPMLASDGELAEKPILVMLQGRMMDATDNRRAGPLLYQDDRNNAALGVPGAGDPIDDQGIGPVSNRMWIALNDHSSLQTIRQANRFSTYNLECNYVNHLRDRVPDVDEYVIRYLNSICQ